jgi:hypothetical protein
MQNNNVQIESGMKKIICAIVLFAIAGCTTSPIGAEFASPVPPSRLLAVASIDANATIQVTRDQGVFGSACHLGLFLNGTLAARLGPGETVSLPVKSGEYLVGMASDPEGHGLCSGGVSLREVPAVLKSGERRKYRIFGDMNGGFSITPTSL